MALPDPEPRDITGNAGARRVAAHRSTHGRLDVSVSPQVNATIDDLARMFGASRAVVVRSLLRYALTNRDWRRMGLLWGPE